MLAKMEPLNHLHHYMEALPGALIGYLLRTRAYQAPTD
jgi:hypothetical protein